MYYIVASTSILFYEFLPLVHFLHSVPDQKGTVNIKEMVTVEHVEKITLKG